MAEKSATGEVSTPVQAAVRTVLFPDSAISGKLSYDLPVKIDSKFTGEVKASDLLVVGANAHVEARVAARNLQLEGKLIGSVQVIGCFEISKGTRKPPNSKFTRARPSMVKETLPGIPEIHRP
jgi:cytoskeletal protein CcmA (bactofilin family)